MHALDSHQTPPQRLRLSGKHLQYICAATFGGKKQCWESLQNFLQQNELDNIILDGNLNVTLAQEEKRGGSIVRDPAREWVEDLVSAWDLINIKPAKGLYTWRNKRIGPGHIAARLDRFLVQSSFLLLGLTATAEILSHSVSDHKPLHLEIRIDQVRGPIPFIFNLTWIQDKDFFPLVSKTWTDVVKGSSFYV